LTKEVIIQTVAPVDIEVAEIVAETIVEEND
jgi:hypothetical protein